MTQRTIPAGVTVGTRKVMTAEGKLEPMPDSKQSKALGRPTVAEAEAVASAAAAETVNESESAASAGAADAVPATEQPASPSPAESIATDDPLFAATTTE